MKKLTAIFLAFTLVFTSVGGTLFAFDDHQVEAKSYKSGKKGFKSNNNNSNIQNKDNDSNTNNNGNVSNNQNNTTNKNTKDTTTKKGGFSSGGLVKGLFIGGLAGLLFGSLFSDLGVLGSILGFMINAGAILLVVFLAVKLVQMMTRKKDKEKEATQWKN